MSLVLKDEQLVNVEELWQSCGVVFSAVRGKMEAHSSIAFVYWWQFLETSNVHSEGDRVWIKLDKARFVLTWQRFAGKTEARLKSRTSCGNNWTSFKRKCFYRKFAWTLKSEFWINRYQTSVTSMCPSRWRGCWAVRPPEGAAER